MSLDALQDAHAFGDHNRSGDLAETLVARLCHDLASPLGAIGNGVELLEMLHGGTGPATGPELQLVSASIRHANARLRMFRLAFGPTQTEQMTGAAEMRALIHAHRENARCWTEYAIDIDIPRADAKTLVLGLMCLETALVWGGAVGIAAGPDGYTLHATTERMRWDTSLWAQFTDPAKALPMTAANVHFACLAREVARRGYEMTLGQDAQSILMYLKRLPKLT